MELICDIKAPSTSEPRMKVKRVKKGTACSACHARKRRCDAVKPKCGPCTRNREQECVYTTLKLKPRTLILQQKIEGLEAQVELLQSTTDTARLNPIYNPHIRTLSTRFTRTGALDASSRTLVPHSHGIGTSIRSWWSTDEPPPSGLINVLVNIFLEKEHQQTHDLRPSDFYLSLYDPNPDMGLHPALRNAMFLWACNCDPNHLSQLEPLFLRRTMYYSNKSLAQADRLLDFVEAQVLLAMYYLDKRRYLQGLRGIAATMAFSVACGLHALRPPAWSSDSASLLPRTLCRIELRRRVRVWWMIFTINRLTTSASKIDSDIEDDRIQTLWELPPELDSAMELHSSTVSSLFIRDNKATYVYNDTANAIRSKCTALVDRAARIGPTAPSISRDDHAFWERFEQLDEAIRQVASSLPSLFEEPRFETHALHIELQTNTASKFTTFYHILVCDAAIALHGPLARTGNIASRDACVRACRSITPVVRRLNGQDDSIYSYLIIPCARAFREFCFEYRRLLTINETNEAQLIIPELQTLSRLIKAFPVGGGMIEPMKSVVPSLRNIPGLF
ncbi:hypothetical protein BOTBODRAFT_540437 [Botryobasidium botryosum FD-172 SS1]|uniref:Zn(2)-C6 fungal-type domain-containing protein n=1 Tax=Botryobasidium botryosum (strain FD-172 SS1) TaxID=930990 RepID=A0A067MBJ6_BOTB1|nr:hypothetical protein BOTBODRAFT_540437 [Botryobasidium botryosum FD-172 SS1]